MTHCTPLNPALRRLRQVDFFEFQDSFEALSQNKAPKRNKKTKHPNRKQSKIAQQKQMSSSAIIWYCFHTHTHISKKAPASCLHPKRRAIRPLTALSGMGHEPMGQACGPLCKIESVGHVRGALSKIRFLSQVVKRKIKQYQVRYNKDVSRPGENGIVLNATHLVCQRHTRSTGSGQTSNDALTDCGWNSPDSHRSLLPKWPFMLTVPT